MRLHHLLRKKKRKVIGLMSGTSADGIDASLVEIDTSGPHPRIEELGFETRPYPDLLRKKILEASNPAFQNLDEVLRLNMVVGEYFAEAALSMIKKSGYKVDQIDLVGSHGQTVRHLPGEVLRFKKRVRATLQIGEPAVIARRTGIVTVGDFRISDMASGGEGAPLAPLGHFFLFNKRNSSQMILNLGGIANVTVLPANCKFKDVQGFDTGPCNVILDPLTRILFRKRFDPDGKIASSGRVSQELLRNLKRHKYFKMIPPKSTGREDFDEIFIRKILDSDLSKEDVIATASELIVWSIWDAYRRYVQPNQKIKQLIATGGGVHNKHLLQRLSQLFYPVHVITSDKVGYNPDAVESIVFAILAHRTLNGLPGSLERVTGSAENAVLGKICLP